MDKLSWVLHVQASRALQVKEVLQDAPVNVEYLRAVQPIMSTKKTTRTLDGLPQSHVK